MTNIENLQRNIMLSLPMLPGDYVSFGSTREELATMAEVANCVFAFASEKVRSELESNKIVWLQSPLDFKDLAPSIVRIDAHDEKGNQTDAESKMVIGFTKMLLEHQPMLFIRNEDPEQTDMLIHVLDNRGFESYFIPEVSEDGQKIGRIWLVGVHRDHGVDFGWETASETGHPTGESIVRLVVH